MKQIIIRIPDDWDEDTVNSIIQESFNMGFTHFLANGETAKRLAKIERVSLYSLEESDELGDYFLVYDYDKNGKDKLDDLFIGNKPFGIRKEIANKDDEKLVIGWANQYVNFVICYTADWKIIPFENLIANLSTLETQLFADVGSNLDDVELLLHTLERGVDGFVFTPESENDLIELKKMLKTTSTLELQPATIKEIIPIPEADRVCVDTSSMLRVGEGMLVGSTARGFALVHAEVFESEFVASRPFRVNAGDVSEYILVPEEKPDGSLGTRTRYLAELSAGDKVLVVNTQGEMRVVSLGRVKIETRPMLLFKLVAEKDGHEVPINVSIQNAETVRLVGEDGKAISGTELKVGDKVLVYIGPGATHFGTAIKETILEK